MNKNLANKAAKWWADRLREDAKLDNGDESEMGLMTFLLAKMLQAEENSKGSMNDADKFEIALSKILERRNDTWLAFGVDYHPDHILQEAASKANIDLGMTRLPWKTTMRIEEGKVFVRCGYAANEVEI